jgi:hypothetical protein
MGYHFIIKINWGKVSHGWGVGVLYFTTCVSYDSRATTTNMLLPLSTWHNNLTMTSWFWQYFWQTHANCHASVYRAQSALLANPWRLAWVGQNGRQKTFAQAAMQGCWVPPLSLVDNIKFISLIMLIILTSGSIILLKGTTGHTPHVGHLPFAHVVTVFFL